MASGVYNSGKAAIGGNATYAVSWLSDTIKVMLIKSTYTYDKDAHHMVGDIVAYEIAATNYTGAYGGAGRKTLAAKAVNIDDPNDRAEFDDTADITWTALGGAINDTVGGCVIFKELTSDALSPLIAWVDFSPDIPTNGGNLTIAWNAEGIIQLGE